MSGIWSKLTDNKGVTAAVAAVGLGGLVYWAYKNYKEEQGSEEEQASSSAAQASQVFQQVGIEAALAKFKSEVDINNPTLGDIKRLLTLLANHVKNKTLLLSNKVKAERRKRFPKAKRMSQLEEYFKYSSEGIMQLQGNIMQLQKEQHQHMATVGISQHVMARHAQHLGPFMQELVFDSNVTLEQLRQSIVFKIQYLENHGQELIQSLIELGSSLSMQEKQTLPLFLNIVISDEALEGRPDLDRQDLQMAFEKYKQELGPEMMKLEKLLMPMMGQLQTALMGDQMGGYGGYGEGDMMGMGGMGDMGGMGMSEEMVMQQLEQLRMSDPQAYEQLMLMMQAQGGR